MSEQNKDSMLFWYPKIKDLDIPQPKTKCVTLSDDEYYATMDCMPESIVNKIAPAIREFKLPVFIRTDQSSAKHYWEDTCYYDGSRDIRKHLYEICEFNHCCDFMGLSFRAIFIREYISMASRYTAFLGNMPVNPERRYFIKDGKILCHHPYWIKDAIQNPSVDNWQQLSDEMNRETEEEVRLLSGYALQVAKAMDNGYYSIDFCLAQNGKWYFIDMATGENSWHPECKHKE